MDLVSLGCCIMKKRSVNAGVRFTQQSEIGEEGGGGGLTTYPIVVIVTKAHQNPSKAPWLNLRGNSSGLCEESYKERKVY